MQLEGASIPRFQRGRQASSLRRRKGLARSSSATVINHTFTHACVGSMRYFLYFCVCLVGRKEEEKKKEKKRESFPYRVQAERVWNAKGGGGNGAGGGSKARHSFPLEIPRRMDVE